MKYEDHIRWVCGEDWKTVSAEERTGGYGVACMKAYMMGVRPSLPELSKHLAVTADDINVPFVRLLRSGAFSRDGWNPKNDEDMLSSDEEAHKAWSFVAAVSSGFLGNG